MRRRLAKGLALLSLSVALVGCKQGLLEKLDQQQANEVLAALQRNNIVASKVNKGKEGYTIEVNPADFAAAVALLKTYNLPSRPRVDIDQVFPPDSLVTSPRAEKARLYSAIEQRLEQSLAAMPNIISARVDVSYDTTDSDSDKPAPTHVSALAVYDQDTDPSLLISDIKRFLKNSFTDLSYDNISVVVARRAALQHNAPTSGEESQSHMALPLIGMVAGGILVIGALVGGWRWMKQRSKPAANQSVAEK